MHLIFWRTLQHEIPTNFRIKAAFSTNTSMRIFLLESFERNIFKPAYRVSQIAQLKLNTLN